MEFKFPKKIVIGDNLFKIKYKKKSYNASVVYPGKNKCGIIKIGIKELKHNPVGILSSIIHELKEIIQIEQGTRFDNHVYGSDYYEFHYTHAQHQDLCNRLSGLLLNFIK